MSESRCADALKALAEGRFTGSDTMVNEPLASRLQGDVERRDGVGGHEEIQSAVHHGRRTTGALWRGP